MKKNKILGVLVALCMVVTMIPFSAFADTQTTEPAKPEDPTSGIAINEANFPDEVFRNYVLEKFDTNGDESLSATEIAKAKKIDLDEDLFEAIDQDMKDNDGDIDDDNDCDINDDCDIDDTDDNDCDVDANFTGVINLKGIEYLTELTDLSIEELTIVRPDLSKNLKLYRLDFDNIKLVTSAPADKPAVKPDTNTPIKPEIKPEVKPAPAVKTAPTINRVVRDDDELLVKVKPVKIQKGPKKVTYKYAIKSNRGNKWKVKYSKKPFYEFEDLRSNRKYNIAVSYSYRNPTSGKLVTSNVTYKTVKTLRD